MVINASAPYRPIGGAANLLLDDYPNAAAAYSLRKLRTAYTGAAIRVRKDTTGQPEQDIGFTATGDLDTAALKSFLNARSGFVVMEFRWISSLTKERNFAPNCQKPFSVSCAPATSRPRHIIRNATAKRRLPIKQSKSI